MTAIALQHPKLFHFLTAIDEDLAARRRSLGCSFCGGVLHSAAYVFTGYCDAASRNIKPAAMDTRRAQARTSVSR